MQAGSHVVAFLTTQAHSFQPNSLQLPPRPIRPTPAIMWAQQMEELPESSMQALFIPQCGSPSVKAAIKHLD